MKRNIIKKAVFTPFLTLCFLFNSPTYADKSISDLQNERDNLKSQSQNTQNSLDETKQEKSSILQEVERLDNELLEAVNEYEKLNSQLEETKKNLEDTEKDLETAKKNKENQIETFKERIRIMYENGNEGYFEIVLESEDFSDLLKRFEYVDKIVEFDQNIIQEYEETEKRIEADIENIKVKKSEIEKLSKDAEEKKDILDKRIEEKEEMVKKLSEDEKKYLQKLEDLKSADNEIKELILKEQARLAERRRIAQQNATASNNKTNNTSSNVSKPASTNSSSSSKPTTTSNTASTASNTTSNKASAPDTSSSSSSGKMLHPVPAYSGSAPNDTYGYRVNPISGKNELHSGLDLKATMNTDVVAAASGTVIFAGVRGGYGNTVIIDHGDGTSTLYAHNTSLSVSSGEEVSRGQVIAKAGTSGYSTGVHVHFEVRKNGNPVDPASYLQ